MPSSLLSRRTVLKLGALATVALGIGMPLSWSVKSAVAQESSSTEQIGYIYDQQRCIGCRSCENACQETNTQAKEAEQVKWRRVISTENNSDKIFLSISCNHCAEPACEKVCPVKAYTKRKDGIVLHDSAKCVGCKYCLYACPYHAPQFSEKTKRVSKCQFCFRLQDKGRKPACVEACPTKALSYGKLSDLSKTDGGVTKLKGLPPSNLTKPSWIIIPKV